MTTWLNFAAVAAGGAAGSCIRYLVTVATASLSGGSTMLGTTLVNVVGCAAIGAVAEFGGLAGTVSDRSMLAVRVGLLGGLTTFSSFAFEANALAEDGRFVSSGLYVAANVGLGWVALIASGILVRTSLT